MSIKRQQLFLAAACLPLALASPFASARAYHTQSFDDGLIARCSTVNTSTLPDASLERYDIEGDEDRGLLSCLVQRRDQDFNVDNLPAEIRAEYHTLGETPEPIETRRVLDEDLVTYIGTYDVDSRYPLVFRVVMLVDGEEVEMNFDDQRPYL